MSKISLTTYSKLQFPSPQPLYCASCPSSTQPRQTSNYPRFSYCYGPYASIGINHRRKYNGDGSLSTYHIPSPLSIPPYQLCGIAPRTNSPGSSLPNTPSNPAQPPAQPILLSLTKSCREKCTAQHHLQAMPMPTPSGNPFAVPSPHTRRFHV